LGKKHVFFDFVRTCCFENGVLFLVGSMTSKEGMLFSPNCGGLVYLKCGTKTNTPPSCMFLFLLHNPFFLLPSSLTSPHLTSLSLHWFSMTLLPTVVLHG
jgi:hypothetical protein